MPRKKKSHFWNLRKKKNEGAFKMPQTPSEASEPNRSESVCTTHSSEVGSESSTVTTRSQARRALKSPTTAVLPGFVPVDVVAWQQSSVLHHENEEEPPPGNALVTLLHLTPNSCKIIEQLLWLCLPHQHPALQHQLCSPYLRLQWAQ